MVYFSTVISLQNSSVKSAFERHPDLSEQVSLTNSLFLEKSLPLILAKILELHITPSESALSENSLGKRVEGNNLQSRGIPFHLNQNLPDCLVLSLIDILLINLICQKNNLISMAKIDDVPNDLLPYYCSCWISRVN